MNRTDIEKIAEKTEFGPGKRPLYFKNNGLFAESMILNLMANSSTTTESSSNSSSNNGSSSNGSSGNGKNKKDQNNSDQSNDYRKNKSLFTDIFLDSELKKLEKPNTSFNKTVSDFWNVDEDQNNDNFVKFDTAFTQIKNLWTELDEDVALYAQNEGQLEDEWIRPIFKILGWHISVQERISRGGRKKWPDYALFHSQEAKKASKNATEKNRFEHAVAISEAKDWDISLDGKTMDRNPSYQTVNYMQLTGKEWGILTNGRLWRLYSLKSDSRHETYYEIDIIKILSREGKERETFKYFYNFFRAEAFVKNPALNNRSFLDFVFDNGKSYAVEAEKKLKERAFEVTQHVCQGFIAAGAPTTTEEEKRLIYDNALHLLFKMLFILNCESKGLLGTISIDTYQKRYSLRKLCFDIKGILESGDGFSETITSFADRMNTIFSLLKRGDSSLEIHGFGDEVFEQGESFFNNYKLSDYYLAHALYTLSVDWKSTDETLFIDYQRLASDHLGSIFEGLLEFILDKDGENYVLKNDRGEKENTGSYYTKAYIVDYMIASTLDEMVKGKTSKEILELTVVDPAMGSGHFLLGALKFLERKIQEYQNTTQDDFIDLSNLREKIIKNCLYGVDIQPLAVQLAKFSLWIYTAKKNTDLVILDSNFKDGNSLIGFSWNDEFSSVFTKGGFDAVVGNPPYGAKISSDDKDRLSLIYPTREKNSACFFIFLINDLIKTGGSYSFIVPKSICYSERWQDSTIRILDDLKILIDASKAFEDVLLEQVIFVCHKSTLNSSYKIGFCEKFTIHETTKVEKVFYKDSGVLITGITKKEFNLIEKIKKNMSHTLGDFVDIQRGLNWQSKQKRYPGRRPIYRGAHLGKYIIEPSNEGISMSSFCKSEYKYQLRPKILNQLALAHVQNPRPHFYMQATLDEQGDVLVYETISVTTPKEKKVINLKLLLAINNSKVFEWIVYKYIYSSAIRSTRYDQTYISKVPCPDLTKLKNKKVERLVDQLLKSSNGYESKKSFRKDTKKILDEIDIEIAKIFGLSKSEIDILDYENIDSCTELVAA